MSTSITLNSVWTVDGGETVAATAGLTLMCDGTEGAIGPLGDGSGIEGTFCVAPGRCGDTAKASGRATMVWVCVCSAPTWGKMWTSSTSKSLANVTFLRAFFVELFRRNRAALQSGLNAVTSARSTATAGRPNVEFRRGFFTEPFRPYNLTSLLPSAVLYNDDLRCGFLTELLWQTMTASLIGLVVPMCAGKSHSRK